MSNFDISFNLFEEYDNFDDWDAAEERETEKKIEKRHKELVELLCTKMNGNGNKHWCPVPVVWSQQIWRSRKTFWSKS